VLREYVRAIEPPRPHSSQQAGAVLGGLCGLENIYQALATIRRIRAIDDSTVDEGALDDAVELLSHLRNGCGEVQLRHGHRPVYAISTAWAATCSRSSTVGVRASVHALHEEEGSSEILLSIDAIEMMHTRPELDMFVIVGGTRLPSGGAAPPRAT